MAIVNNITANCESTQLSQQMISRQWDDKGTLIQFAGYPQPDNDEALIFRLIVWMKESENAEPRELPPILLDADQWLVSNYYTQLVQTIKFQLCITNESGTFEKHSPIFAGHIGKSLSHNGQEGDIDVIPLFDPYKNYVDERVNELIVAAGDVQIDAALRTSGAAADAKATGDAIAGVNGRLTGLEYNPSFANQSVEFIDLIKDTQRDNYTHPSISGGTINKIGANGFYIPTGTFAASATEAYISYASFALTAGQKYTMFVRYNDDNMSEIGISIKGKKAGESANTVVKTDTEANAATRNKNIAFVFTAGYDYTGCYVNLYKSSGAAYTFNNFVVSVYLAPGEWTAEDFDKLYKVPEAYRCIAQMPFYNISAKVFSGNLVEGTQYPGHRVHDAMTVDKVYYSGFLLNGTLTSGDRNYLSRGAIHLETGKDYTMYVRTTAPIGSNIAFALRSASANEYVKMDDANVSTRSINSVYHFRPDVGYSDVYITVFQNTGEAMELDNYVVYVYIVEGTLNAEDFDYIYTIMNKEDISIDVSQRVRMNNLVEGTQYKDQRTVGSLTIDKVFYSGFKINGELENETPRYISKALINLDSTKDYTMYVKTAVPISTNIAFSLRTGVGAESRYVQMNGVNVSTRNINNAYYFRPDEDYTGAYLNIWQNTGETVELNDLIVYIYIVEERYTNEEFDLNSKYTIGNYQKRSVAYGLNVGLPVISFDGDIASMTKENAVTVNWEYNFMRGTATLKWQGSSSVAYSKKNYTVKFDKKLDFGWGAQKKYVLKGNYIDNTSALNVCGAKLWASIVRNRGVNPAIEVGANCGAMDGFPVIVTLNGAFFGLYTLNTPKDQWTFGMDESQTEYIVTAEDHSTATQFKGTTALEGEDFELEYAADGVEAATVRNSVNTLINAAINATGENWEETVAQYVDIDSVIDYMIFSALITNIDGIDKNFILTTYDGVKWWFNAYDVDSTFGMYWNGGSYVKISNTATSFAGQNNTSRLFHLVYRYSTSKLVARYDQLRSTLLSEENVYDLFYNFCSVIPKEVVDMDNQLYPYKPGTYTQTLARIMDNYRLRCKFIDAEIDALR